LSDAGEREMRDLVGSPVFLMTADKVFKAVVTSVNVELHPYMYVSATSTSIPEITGRVRPVYHLEVDAESLAPLTVNDGDAIESIIDTLSAIIEGGEDASE